MLGWLKIAPDDDEDDRWRHIIRVEVNLETALQVEHCYQIEYHKAMAALLWQRTGSYTRNCIL